MKKAILKLLRKTGRTIKPINTYEEKLHPVKNLWLKNKNIKTVFDIGASDGGFAREIRELLPTAKIYSFEALPEIYEKLESNFIDDALFQSYNIALSNYNGQTSFFRCESSGSSSILEMDELHKTAYPGTKNNEKINIMCSTLDDFIANENIVIDKNVLIKIDVQGAEKLVLEGAENLLSKSELIFSEINFNSVYKGNVLFNDLASFLEEKGFKIEGIKNVSQSLVDGTFLQADAFFSKDIHNKT